MWCSSASGVVVVEESVLEIGVGMGYAWKLGIPRGAGSNGAGSRMTFSSRDQAAHTFFLAATVVGSVVRRLVRGSSILVQTKARGRQGETRSGGPGEGGVRFPHATGVSAGVQCPVSRGLKRARSGPLQLYANS